MRHLRLNDFLTLTSDTALRPLTAGRNLLHAMTYPDPDTPGTATGESAASPAEPVDAPPMDALAGEKLLASLAFAYRPTWNLRHNAVTTYECVPTLVTGDKRLVGSEITGLANRDVVFGLDLKTVERAGGDLSSLLAADQRSLMVIPVHFQTLSTISRRTDYLNRCRALIPADNAKYVAFEILDVPEGVITTRFQEVASALRKIGRALLVRLPSSRMTLPPVREIGIAGLGYECRGVAGGEASEIQDMQRFAALVQRAGISSFLYNVRSLSLASAAIGAGVGFVNGDAIAPLCETPRAIYNFDLAGLYAQRLGLRPGPR